MTWEAAFRRGIRSLQLQCAFVLLVVGEALIVIRVRPYSDFYFPFSWFGFILLLDAASRLQSGASLFVTSRRIFWTMIPLSAAFWWLFEWLNLAVNNWVYVGGSQYTGLAFAGIATLDFSTVLLAVWSSARVVFLLQPERNTARTTTPPVWLSACVLVLGIGSLLAAIAFPNYAFGLIWGCLALILDPINGWLKRPSILRYLWSRQWRTPVSLAVGSLFCGVFWEAWNFWSLPKWQYNVPYVGFFHVFEMPILGYLGYLPFGLELFALANFALPWLRLGTINLDLSSASSPTSTGTRTDEYSARVFPEAG